LTESIGREREREMMIKSRANRQLFRNYSQRRVEFSERRFLDRKHKHAIFYYIILY
jgi:hypothetical protein